MNTLVETLNLHPLVIGAVLLAVLLLLAGAAILIVLGLRFKSRLKKTIDSPEALEDFRRRYPPEILKRCSRRMEKYARQWGKKVIQDTGMDEIWTENLSSKTGKKDLRRVLLYCREQDLFKAFLAAMKNPKLQAPFLTWAGGEGSERVVRLLGAACRGEEFDGGRGMFFAGDHLDTLREMTGDPEWYVRYFAYRFLLYDDNPRTLRAIEDGLKDPHPLVRKILAEGFAGKDRDKSYKLLWDMLIHDPVFEVRQAAKKRIQKDFYDLYAPSAKKLQTDEAVRILQLLDQASQEDRSLALDYLKNENRELSFPAAVFLEKCGVLDRILAENSQDDPVNLERNYKLLQKAVEVNVSGFLDRLSSTSRPASLLVAARLLRGKGGTQESMNHLAEEVFRFFSSGELKPEHREIYSLTLEAITIRGNDRAFNLYRRELDSRENQPEFLKLLLPRVPIKADYLFLPTLIRFLKNTAFPCREELINILSRFTPDLLLPELFKILDGPRAKYPHIIRMSALRILGMFKLPYCLQRVLESLPTLPQAEAREFAPLFKEYPQELFEEKTAALLASPDGQIRASLITVLPATGNLSFLKEIRGSLRDADPEVRIAAIRALLEYGEIRLLNQETSMLRDPVERVRLATAQVIGQHGNPSALEVLTGILKDPNEAEAVKRSIVAAMGISQNARSLEILAELLENREEFRNDATKALSNRTSKKDIIQLIEIFKDASPDLREKLVAVFRAQGEDAEPEIRELLEEGIASLKPYLTRILEETGAVEETIRKLSNKNVRVRRDAARWLSLTGTPAAFRGLVMAAKDPDQEVRVLVVKALEKLSTPQGREILEGLKEDPDTRIRKYTYWALERLDTLAGE